MNIIRGAVLFLGVSAVFVSAQDSLDLRDRRQKFSYALGMEIAGSLKWDGVDIDLAALAAGLADMQEGRPALGTEQRVAILEAMQKDITARAAQKKKIDGARNLEAGKVFFAANARREGVRVIEVTAPDGTKAEMQYEIIKSGGGGMSPGVNMMLTAHYEGRLLDGTVFDSSRQRNEPYKGRVNDFIAGWTEPLSRMKIGDKWRLFVPPSLAYGEAVPYNIGPYSTLIYDLELISIELGDGDIGAK